MAKTTRSDIFEQVKGILKEQLYLDEEKVKSITRLTNICQDLGADDLDGVEIIIALEEQFGISISEDECHTNGMTIDNGGEKFTVGNCVDFVCQKFGIK